jgi:hypothetical protein
VAVYNEVQVGRYVRFLQKFLGIKGRQPAPLTFAGELGAFWGLFHGAENRYLEGWDRFGQVFSVPGSAANNSQIQLRNPSNSKVIAVFERIEIWNQTVAGQPRLRLNPQSTDLGTLVGTTNYRWDARGRISSALIASTQNNSAVGSLTPTQWQLNSNAAYDKEVIGTDIQEIPMLPGDALNILEVQTNVAISANLWWRERLLEEGELT